MFQLTISMVVLAGLCRRKHLRSGSGVAYQDLSALTPGVNILVVDRKTENTAIMLYSMQQCRYRFVVVGSNKRGILV